jgi:hypothetical protein
MTFPAALAVGCPYNASSVVENWATVAWRRGHLISQHLNSVTAENNVLFKLVSIACNLTGTWTKDSIARRELNTRRSGFNRWTIRYWRCNVMCRQCKRFYIPCTEVFFRQSTMMFSLVHWHRRQIAAGLGRKCPERAVASTRRVAARRKVWLRGNWPAVFPSALHFMTRHIHATQTLENSFGFVSTAPSREPPWAFWQWRGEEGEDLNSHWMILRKR